MAMPHDLHELLKEACGDRKYKENDLIKLIVTTYDESEKLTESVTKLETANSEISKEREELKEKVKTIITEKDTAVKSLTEKDTIIQKLKEGELSEDERKKLLEIKQNNGMTEDVKAQFNTLGEQVKILSEQIISTEAARKQAEESAKEAKLASRVVEAKTTLATELEKVDIRGENARLALLDLENSSLFKVENKEDGGYETKFYTNNAEKKFTATAEELAIFYAEKYQNLVSSSGNVGSGLNHSSDYNNFTPKQPVYGSRKDAQAAAAAMLET